VLFRSTLGATTVQTLAAELEKLIRDGASAEVCVALSSRLETEQVRLAAALQGALTAQSAKQDALGNEALAHLEKLLQEDDLAAAEALRAARARLVQVLPAAELARLTRQVETYDFQGALETLRARP
jgi:hypothetical protein